MEFNKTNVLGVEINDMNLNQALETVKGWLEEKSEKKHYIVTPNPEFIMAAQDDLEFKKVLNQADLAISDGVGLKLSGKIKNTTPGVDLMEELCFLASKRGFVVGFLGGRGEVAKKVAERLKKKYPGLKVALAQDGGEVDKNGNLTLPSPLAIPACDLLFVGFGAVKQEKWIAKNLDKAPVRIMMGVGGAFDYFSGNVKRAPIWIRRLGLEWLFRLIIQPWRIKRQFQLLRFILLLKK